MSEGVLSRLVVGGCGGGGGGGCDPMVLLATSPLALPPSAVRFRIDLVLFHADGACVKVPRSQKVLEEQLGIFWKPVSHMKAVRSHPA